VIETFYAAAVITIVATILAITRKNVVHGLLYLIVSLLAVAVIFFALGAPFIAALEVIVYAGAIMVLLNLGPATVEQERRWEPPRIWIGPTILSGLLLAGLLYGLSSHEGQRVAASVIEPRGVGIALFTQYALAVEIASMLLLSALIGAYHLGRREMDSPRAIP